MASYTQNFDGLASGNRPFGLSPAGRMESGAGADRHQCGQQFFAEQRVRYHHQRVMAPAIPALAC